MTVLVLWFSLIAVVHATANYSIPQDFILSVATSAYQVEGGWNEGGRGPSIWDTYTQDHAENIVDGSNGSIAVDSYHLYQKDVEALKELGVGMYRFSISWSRVLPTGYANNVNPAGLEYYSDLINLLKMNRIEPMVTLYHWDLPQKLQDLGGWANPVMADLFEDYANLIFSHFGDRVKWWITINEPSQIAKGYNSTSVYAPGVDSNDTWIGFYLAMHNLILAHAKAYRLYELYFKNPHGGKVGVVIPSSWNEPLSKSTADKETADFVNQYLIGLQAHPIFSESGDYPEIVKEFVSRTSKQLGLRRSRLPTFSPEEVAYIRGTSDFYGLNYYGTKYVSARRLKPVHEMDFTISYDPKWPSSSVPTFKVVPWGLRKVLNWVKNQYNIVPVFITENGYAGDDFIQDSERVAFLVEHMKEMLNAMKEDGCNVIGYTYWTLMDNFEWKFGYTQRFGLFYVNLSNPCLCREPKHSAHVYAEIIKSRQLPLKALSFTMPNNTRTDVRSASSSLGANLLWISVTCFTYILVC